MAITGDEHFLKCLESFHGINLSPAELRQLHRDLADRQQTYQRAAWNARQVGDYWGAEDEITAGKIGSLILGTALGFLSGGWLGAGLALLSGLLGGKKKEAHKEEERFSAQQGFDSGGQLAPSGGTLPRIYCNRNINPAGGVRVGGILINSRIDTRRGTSLLYQLYAISAGQSPKLNYGQLGAIDDSKALFNQQPRSNFNNREITTGYRLGLQNQSQIPEFPHYSQNITPPDYSIFGVDERAKVGSTATAINPNPREINATTTGNTIEKNVGVPSGWNAGVFGETGLIGDGFFRFNTPSSAAEMVVGMSSTYIDENWISVQFGFLFQGGNYTVVENGIARTSLSPIAGISSFTIEISGGQIDYLANSEIVWESTISPSLPIFPDIKIFTASASVSGLSLNGSGFDVNLSNTGTILTPTATSKDEAPNQVLDLFTPSQDYVVSGSGEISRDQKFMVIDKDYAANTITTTPSIAPSSGQPIYAYWYARYETTKRVDRIDFNLAFNLSARHQGNSKDKNNGKLVTHASLFDVWLRPTSDPVGAEVRLVRLLCKNATPVRINRAIRVMNLKLGRYYFEFRPLTYMPPDQTSLPVYELTDHGYGIADAIDLEDLPTYATGVIILGNAISIQGELQLAFPGAYSYDEINKWITYGKKTNVSTESGATGKITSINEIVHKSSINQFAPYKGLALVWYRFVASDRLLQAPGTRTLVSEGTICPNWVSAGTSNNALSAGNTLVSPASNFIADGIQAGWICRNLDKGIESIITSVGQVSLTTASSLQWGQQCGDRFAVFFLGATCYFPDIYADLIRNDFGGIPDLLDPDEYIDYPSIVSARKFCVANKYFFDDVIDQRAPFQEWTNNNARLSFLFPSRIDGRYGLAPDKAQPIEAVFNAANSESFSLEYPDWSNEITNTIVIRYVDGREKFEQFGARHRQTTITVQTAAAFNGIDPAISQEIEARSVKNADQAIDVACLYLKSLRLNNARVNFETSYAAAYVQAGDIASVQHNAADIGDEYSGYADEIAGNLVRLNCQPILRRGYASSNNQAGLTDDEADFNSLAIKPGDLLLNLENNNSATILAVNNQSISAPIEIAADDEYAIFNLTLPSNFEATITRREDGAIVSSFVALAPINNQVWLQFPSNLQILQGDYINIAGADRFWRIQSIQPNGKERFSVACSYWQASIYNRADLIIMADDEVIQN